MKERRSRLYESLDLWRGFAAIWVVLFHSISSIETDLGQGFKPNIFTDFCKWGDGGVFLFFVISGYCITAAAANLVDKKQPISHFITARVRRIFPPHWVVLLLFILMAGVAFFAQQRGWISGSNLAERFTLLTPWAILSNAVLIQVPVKQDSINIVAWTLSYEVAFYAVVALAIVALRKQGWQKMVQVLHLVTLITFSLVVFAPRWALFPFDLWMSFGAGVLLFDLLCGQLWKERSKSEKLFYAGTMIALSLLIGFYVNYNWESKGAWQNAAALLFTVLLYGLHSLDRKISQTKLLRGLFFVGSFSYSLYLTHFLIVGILRQIAKKLHVPVPLFGLEMLMDVIVCIVFAYIFYRLVESRFMRAKSKPVTTQSIASLDPITREQTSPG